MGNCCPGGHDKKKAGKKKSSGLKKGACENNVRPHLNNSGGKRHKKYLKYGEDELAGDYYDPPDCDSMLDYEQQLKQAPQNRHDENSRMQLYHHNLKAKSHLYKNNSNLAKKQFLLQQSNFVSNQSNVNKNSSSAQSSQKGKIIF